jgi:hypothetical protein
MTLQRAQQQATAVNSWLASRRGSMNHDLSEGPWPKRKTNAPRMSAIAWGEGGELLSLSELSAGAHFGSSVVGPVSHQAVRGVSR